MTDKDVIQLKVLKSREEIDRSISKLKDVLANMEVINTKLGQLALLLSQGK